MWLPQHKQCAICFSIDDVHPGKSTDAYEAGGDLENGVLRHVEWLLKRHPRLHVTLFVTADWRELSPLPSRTFVCQIPYLRDYVYLTPILPKGTMHIGRHPSFVAYVKSLERTDVALHGLHHVNKGLAITEEYQGKNELECRRRLQQTMKIFEEAGLPYSPGMCPPCWNVTNELASAMIDVGLRFVASARDINTPITPGAVNSMSGLKGASILFPQKIMDGRLVHVPTNFQATSATDRAQQILRLGGLLSIKAHAVKSAFGFVQLDGLDEGYRDFLHRLFVDLENNYGDDLWWTSMAEITARCSGEGLSSQPSGAI
jgi:hypothetical protein